MTEPGWYTDPRDSSQYRYWDGTSWTEAVAPGAAAESFAGSGDSQSTGESSTAQESASDAAEGAVIGQAGAVTDAVSEQTDNLAGRFDSVADQVDGVGGQVDGVAGQAAEQLDGVTGQVAGQLDGVTGQIDGAASGLSDRLGGGADVSGGSVAAAFESAATATPLDNPSALADNAVGAVQETAATAIPVDSSAGLSVDEALQDVNPADAASSIPGLDGARGGQALDGIGQGISVDDVLSDVETPFSDAAETMVVDVPDFGDAPGLGETPGLGGSPGLGDVGIPGDGRSFSSPIDTFGPADETAVIPGADLSLADPDAPQHTDRFGAPPPTPSPAGLDGSGAASAAPGFDQGPEFNAPTPGLAPPGAGGPPPGSFDGLPAPQFGQPGPGGAGFESGGAAFGDQVAPRPITAPPVTPSKSRTPWLVLGGIGLAIVGVLVFLALRSPERTSVDAIAEGQCFADFNQFEATEIRSSVSSADCVDEHALEVFEVTDAPYVEFSEYPGEEVITDLAFRHCLDGFEEFVGITYEDSSLDVWALYPTEGSWNLNSDREVVCMVGAFDQSLTTGTLQGSGR